MTARVATAERLSSTNLDSYLGPGEKVLWRGKPEQKPFVFRTWPLSIFGAVLMTAVIAYETIVFTTDAPKSLAFWGVPFGLAGLYMVAGHFLVTYCEWRQTEYMLTDTRLLIRHGIFTPTVTVNSVLGLPHTRTIMRDRAVGNILFVPPNEQGYGPWPGYQTMWPYTPGYLLGLMYVRNPHEIVAAIERARHGE